MLSSQSIQSPAFVPPVDNLVDLLRARASSHAGKLAYAFLTNGEEIGQQFTFDELDEKVKAIGAALQARGLAGERALLLFPSGLDYVAAFLGCLYAGVIAVPVYPPQMGKQISRIESIVDDSQAAIFLSNQAVWEGIENNMPELISLAKGRWLLTDEVEAEMSANWYHPEINANSIAFLQYTSGSTGNPKGVMVSHGNLLHNEYLISNLMKTDETTVIVSWLPLFHDMGLIGNVLHALYLGVPAYLMSPFSFLQRPIRWLRAITRFGATFSGGPNFAYDLCVSRITEEEKSELDLRSWGLAYNGAEPVRAETLQRFAEAFEGVGFSFYQLQPVYGMAETTLVVSGNKNEENPIILSVDSAELAQHRIVPVHEDHPQAAYMVGCGRTSPDLPVRIVHPDTHMECRADEVGEIWVQGDSICQGYWQKPEVTEETFQAHIADTGEGPFLRTGDLGFIQEGELFITGRIKDLIIIRGRNHYPQDIELTSEKSHSACRPGGSAAFSVDVADEERLVVIQEVEKGLLKKTGPEPILAAMQKAISTEHELQPYALILVKRRSILKTSSGKIMRRACKQAFLNGTLYVEAEWRAAVDELGQAAEEVQASASAAPIQLDKASIQAWILQWMGKKLQMDPAQIDPDDTMAAYGTDSMMVAEFEEEISQFVGFNWPVMDYLITEPSIAEVASRGAELVVEEQGG